MRASNMCGLCACALCSCPQLKNEKAVLSSFPDPLKTAVCMLRIARSCSSCLVIPQLVVDLRHSLQADRDSGRGVCQARCSPSHFAQLALQLPGILNGLQKGLRLAFQHRASVICAAGRPETEAVMLCTPAQLSPRSTRTAPTTSAGFSPRALQRVRRSAHRRPRLPVAPGCKVVLPGCRWDAPWQASRMAERRLPFSLGLHASGLHLDVVLNIAGVLADLGGPN